jgi:hypothetical protein
VPKKSAIVLRTALLARALIALGGALVHGARGTDVEGAAALHEGIALAESASADTLAATGLREVSWVQFLRAEYERAESSVSRAAELAVVEHARVLLDEALEVVDVRGLTAFRPWPESFRAEIDLMEGDVEAAENRFQHAFAVGCEVGDPCWESIAARGLGLIAAARGDIPAALELLTDAPRLCRRLPDTYLWIEAYGLDALCAVAIESDAASTSHWVDQLEFMTARAGMRELLLRATEYRARLGAPGALDAARSLATQIDSAILDPPLISVQLTAAADERGRSTARIASQSAQGAD